MTLIESLDVSELLDKSILNEDVAPIITNAHPRIIIPPYAEQYYTLFSVEYIIFTPNIIRHPTTEEQLIQECTAGIYPIVTSDLAKFLTEIVKAETTYIYPTVFVAYALSYIRCHKPRNRELMHQKIMFDNNLLLQLRLWANQFRKSVSERELSINDILSIRSFNTSELYIGCYICSHILKFIHNLGY